MRGGIRKRQGCKWLSSGSRLQLHQQVRMQCDSRFEVSWSLAYMARLRALLFVLGMFMGAPSQAVVSPDPGSGRVDFGEEIPIQVLPAPPSLWTGAMQEITVGLRPSKGTIRRRLEATLQAKPFAEPLRLRVTGDLRDFLRGLALPGMRALLEQLPARAVVARNQVFIEAMQRRVRKGILELDARDLSWLDLSLLSQHIETASRVPRLERKVWDDAMADAQHKARLQQFFGHHWVNVLESVTLDSEQGETSDQHSRGLATKHSLNLSQERVRLSVSASHEGRVGSRGTVDPLELVPESDETWIYLVDLLPEHMLDIFGKFSSYRGRNCFATALQFDAPGILSDRSVNLVREEEHHAAMINSDEFAHALWRAYTPLTEAQIDEGLRFGDLVVFFDEYRDPGYRSLLHAAVHVGGRYYFHKPSKSASSPVEFTRWDDMIRVWRRQAKRLGYQVYRRNPVPGGRYADPRALAEKINWTP